MVLCSVSIFSVLSDESVGRIADHSISAILAVFIESEPTPSVFEIIPAISNLDKRFEQATFQNPFFDLVTHILIFSAKSTEYVGVTNWSSTIWILFPNLRDSVTHETKFPGSGPKTTLVLTMQ